MGERTTSSKQTPLRPSTPGKRFGQPARPFLIPTAAAASDLDAQVDRAGRFGHSLERLRASPEPAAAGPVLQMMKVDDSDVGKRFKVNTTDGAQVEADLEAVRGGGWYLFDDGGTKYRVRGADNILSRADKPMDALSRLQRAQDRAESRPALAPLGTRVDAPTPFGPTGLSRQRFSPSDPQTTTRAKDFGGASDPGAPYSGWIGKIGGQPEWEKMMDVVDSHGSSPPPSFTNTQNRSAAMLFGTTHFSEPYRFKAAPKPARSAMRMVAEGTHSPSKFPTLFPMAQGGGAHFYENVLSGSQTLKEEQKEVLEEMSESSDEGEDDWWRR